MSEHKLPIEYADAAPDAAFSYLKEIDTLNVLDPDNQSPQIIPSEQPKHYPLTVSHEFRPTMEPVPHDRPIAQYDR